MAGKKLRGYCEPHKVIRLRQRYFLTRNNTPRLRYLAGGAVSALVVLFVMGGGAQAPMDGVASYDVASIGDAAQAGAASGHEESLAGGAWQITQGLQNQISSGIRKASLAIKKPSSLNAELKIGRGETLAGVLEKAGVGNDDAYQIVKVLSAHVDPRQLKAGQVVNVAFKPGSDDAPEFTSLNMNTGPLKEVTVRKKGDAFVADVAEKELKARTYAGYAKIQNSLYGSAERAGIPPQVLSDVIHLYSRTIDFQRDIRQGDAIEVLYDGQETADGSYHKFGNIIYANMIVGGKSVPIYRFTNKDGNVDYYDEKGNTTRKTLLKTPVDGARVSSGFGMRFHPILGYTRMHKGIDFAVPTGTPIYAAGDGTLDFVGRKNGYGNFISIRHNSEIKTAYGHMYRFAAGMSRGTHVKQGEVIGYVGQTGQATGPHLHYEVIVNGHPVNPRSIDLPTGENLKGREFDRFKRTIAGIRQQFAYLTEGMKVAQADVPAAGDDGNLN